jgi:hypothetical protein
MPRYTVICQWESESQLDADDIVVVTPTPAQAVEKAREKWLRTIGSHWPHCRLTSVFALTPAKLAELT